jgi:hypothetical protein
MPYFGDSKLNAQSGDMAEFSLSIWNQFVTLVFFWVNIALLPIVTGREELQYQEETYLNVAIPITNPTWTAGSKSGALEHEAGD